MKKKINLSLLSLLISLLVVAQKLPQKQSAGVWAPADVKIDGKLSEWHTLKAYNPSTGFYYTLANDEQNLYLAITAKDPDVINRLVGGGVTLSVKLPQAKDAAEFSMTYPVNKPKQILYFSLKTGKGKTPDTSLSTRRELISTYNKRIDMRCKDIVIKYNDVTDTVSIFNDEGLKACGYFDDNKFYNLEIAFNIKKLGLNSLINGQLDYHIIMNGSKVFSGITEIIPPNASPELIANIQSMQQTEERLSVVMSSPTDFRGKYTLAKKP